MADIGNNPSRLVREAANASSAHGYTHRLPRSALPMSQLNLTPEELHLYRYHLHNMTPKHWQSNDDGSTTTVYSHTEPGEDWGGEPGKWYNFPGYVNGQRLKGDALYNAVQPMSQWPKYNSQAEAERRYNEMHGGMQMEMAPSGMLYRRDPQGRVNDPPYGHGLEMEEEDQ